jgi:hypothetical protein
MRCRFFGFSCSANSRQNDSKPPILLGVIANATITFRLRMGPYFSSSLSLSTLLQKSEN